MVRLTEELLRKRAEHNEGCLSTLKEITLHQFEVERIELLGQLCRQLQILYLQNNLIPRIENLEHLKDLRYLNLAINNVERVENLEQCEFLEKLDLTCNFVSEVTSLQNLRSNIHLREIFLTGNPCTSFEGYRSYVIHILPQLQYLDGVEVTKSERIKSAQEFAEVEASIHQQEAQALAQREVQRQEALRKHEEEEAAAQDLKEVELEEEGKIGNKVFGNTPEERLAMHRELSKTKETLENRAVDPSGLTEVERAGQGMKLPKRTPEEEIAKYGRVLQKNEGRFEFYMEEEDPKSIVLRVFPGKFLDSSLIDIDAHPTFIRLTIKGKVLQLVFPEEVKSDQGTALRSEVTGELKLTFPRVKPLRSLADTTTRHQTVPLCDGEARESSSSSSSSTCAPLPMPDGMIERETRRIGIPPPR